MGTRGPFIERPRQKIYASGGDILTKKKSD
jgi:hypothetical protein